MLPANDAMEKDERQVETINKKLIFSTLFADNMVCR